MNPSSLGAEGRFTWLLGIAVVSQFTGARPFCHLAGDLALRQVGVPSRLLDSPAAVSLLGAAGYPGEGHSVLSAHLRDILSWLAG